MLVLGMQVEHEAEPGEIYTIIDITHSTKSGREVYILSTAGGVRRHAFESQLKVMSKTDETIENQLVQTSTRMNLVCKPLMNGIMAYWDEVPEAACYNVKLYINDQVISKRINERTELYHTFTGLAAIDGLTKGEIGKTIPRAVGGGYSNPSSSGLEYYVKVEAENRLGEMIAQSPKTPCKVREF